MDSPQEEQEQTFDRFEWMRGWLRAGLKATTILVLTALLDHMGKDGRAWPSVSTIAGLIGKSPRTVQRHLRIAEKFGWIETNNRGYHSNVYVAKVGNSRAPTPDTHVTTPRHGCHHPPSPMSPPGDTHVTTPLTPVSPPPRHGCHPEQTIEQTIEQRSSSHPNEPEAECFENPKPDPNDDDLVRFILESLADYEINISIGESEKIARRLILSELEISDRRRYLLDWIPRLREKIDSGSNQRKVLSWLGGSKSIGWWQCDVKSARRADVAETEDEAWAREKALQANSHASMDDLMNAMAQGGRT